MQVGGEKLGAGSDVNQEAELSSCTDVIGLSRMLELCSHKNENGLTLDDGVPFSEVLEGVRRR